jgi:hypothetical protein
MKTKLEKDIEKILHLNGCQQRTAGWNEAKDGKDLNDVDMERLEQITLGEVMAEINKRYGKKKNNETLNIIRLIIALPLVIPLFAALLIIFLIGIPFIAIGGKHGMTIFDQITSFIKD